MTHCHSFRRHSLKFPWNKWHPEIICTINARFQNRKSESSGVNLVWNLGSWTRGSCLVKKFRFFQANFKKIHFSRQIPENFDFSCKNFRMTFFFGHSLQNFRLSRQNCHLQLNSGQIILLRLKSHHSRTYFLHMIRYKNVSRPVHDPLRPHGPQAQNLGVATP